MSKLTIEERVRLLKKNKEGLEITVIPNESTLPEYVYIDVMELIDDLVEYKFRYDSASK